MGSIGVVAVATSAKKELSGPPFTANAADNGLSVDSVSGRIVLGNDVADPATPAVLLSNRELPMGGFNVGFTGAGNFGIGTSTPQQSFFQIDLNGMQFGAPSTITSNLLGSGGSYSLVSRDFTANPGGLENDLNLLVAGNAASSRPQIEFSRARGSFAVPLAIQNGDILGNINGFGYDGAFMRTRSAITFVVDGAPAVGSVPTAITFSAGVTAAPERMRITSAGNVGVGTSVPTALVHIAAGTATANTAPLKLTAGVSLAVPENGAFEYDGTNLFFTRAAATRESVLVGNSGAAAPGTTVGVAIVNFYGTAATNFLGDPNNWASVVVGGTTFKIPLYT